MFGAIKLVLVMAISALVTRTSKEDDVALEQISYIYYPIWFKKNEVQALIDLGNNINILTLVYVLKLGLRVYRTIFRAQKIDDSTFKIIRMVLASFQIEDKLERAQFFQETFLLANINTQVVLSMPFLNLSNTNILFMEKKLT